MTPQRDMHVSYMIFSEMIQRKIVPDQFFFLSVLKNGNECSCFEELPVDEVFFVNDVDESDTCNMTCPGSDLYKCGGESSFSIYIASMQSFLL